MGAVLYVDPRGPYPALVTHWYDEARDARSYAGPWPVVAWLVSLARGAHAT